MFYHFIYLFSTLLLFFLAFFCYQKKKNLVINNKFIFLVLAIGGWVITLYSYYYINFGYHVFIGKLNYVFAELIAFFAFWFSYYFPDKIFNIKKIYSLILNIFTTLLIFVTLFSDLIIKDEIIKNGKFETIFGDWYIIFIFYFLLLIICHIGFIVYKYNKVEFLKRQQIKLLTWGAFLSISIGVLTNVFLPLFFSYFELQQAAVLVALFYCLVIFYTIVNYRLMDIRIVVRKIFIYITIAAFAYVIFYLVAWIYQQYLGGVFSPSGYAAGIIIAPLFVLLFYGLDKVVKSFANRYLFTSLYSYQETINKLADELNWYIDLDKIVDLIVDTIKKTMRLDRAGVLLTDITSTPIRYQIAKVIGFNRQNGISLVQDSFLTKYLQKTQKPLVRDELSLLARDTNKQKDKQSFDQLFDHMKHIEASLCLPLMSSKRLIGIIVLGAKVSGDAYTQEDLELLNTMSKQAGIAIENAILYKQVSDLSAHLRKRVDSQVKDIKEKNRQLEKLLAMRSEFLDTASHQLRTPVSVIKGTLEMIATGEMNDLSQQNTGAIPLFVFLPRPKSSSARMVSFSPATSIPTPSPLDHFKAPLSAKDRAVPLSEPPVFLLF